MNTFAMHPAAAVRVGASCFFFASGNGRTVREFVLCAPIAPTLVCALWMLTFDGAAMDMLNSTCLIRHA